MSNIVSEKERKNRDKLFSLMRDNPDLPVIPFVDAEIVAGDEFRSWMGSWGASHIDEYLFPDNDWEPAIFRSDNDVFGTLEKCLPAEEFDKLPDREDECRKFYDALPWTKAIIVNIGLPEV